MFGETEGTDGEWFASDTADVQTFKRRRFHVITDTTAMNLAKFLLQERERDRLIRGVKSNLFQLHLDFGLEGNCEQLSISEARRIIAIVNASGGLKRFEAQHCFGNAQRLIAKDMGETLKYYEGFAVIDLVNDLTHHAWVSINGKVVDLTWRTAFKKTSPGARASYFGVDIPYLDVLRNIFRFHQHRPLMDNQEFVKEHFQSLKRI